VQEKHKALEKIILKLTLEESEQTAKMKRLNEVKINKEQENKNEKVIFL